MWLWSVALAVAADENVVVALCGYVAVLRFYLRLTRCRVARYRLAEYWGAVHLQRVFRGRLGRRWAAHMHRQRAACRITAALRHNAHRRIAARKARRQRAATDMQRVWRGVIGRRRCAVCRRHRDAATGMQRLWRGHIGRRLVRHLTRHRRAAIAIQRVARGRLARVRAARCARERAAARRVTGLFARHSARLRFRASMARHRGALCIQRGYRAHATRQAVAAAIRGRQHAAVRIQSLARGFMARTAYLELLLRHRAAVWVQAVARGYLARVRATHLRNAMAAHRAMAVLTVQRLWRGHRGRVAARAARHTRTRHTCATHIQRVVRGVRGRRRADQQRRHRAAAAPIARLARSWLLRRSAARRTIGRGLYRLVLRRRARVLYKLWVAQRTIAALRLQAVARGHLTRTFTLPLLVARREQRRLRAAISLQRLARGFVARRRRNALRVLRAACASRARLLAFDAVRTAVSNHRFVAAFVGTAFERFRRRTDAACAIQRFRRRVLRRMEGRSWRRQLRLALAAARAQGVVRGYLARRLCHDLRFAARTARREEELRAALAIQRVARGWGLGRVVAAARRAECAAAAARARAVILARQHAVAPASSVKRARAAWKRGLRKIRKTLQVGHFDELSDDEAVAAEEERLDAEQRMRVPEIAAAKEATKAVRAAVGEPTTPPHVRAWLHATTDAAPTTASVKADTPTAASSGAVAGAGASASAGTSARAVSGGVMRFTVPTNAAGRARHAKLARQAQRDAEQRAARAAQFHDDGLSESSESSLDLVVQHAAPAAKPEDLVAQLGARLQVRWATVCCIDIKHGQVFCVRHATTSVSQCA